MYYYTIAVTVLFKLVNRSAPKKLFIGRDNFTEKPADLRVSASIILCCLQVVLLYIVFF